MASTKRFATLLTSATAVVAASSSSPLQSATALSAASPAYPAPPATCSGAVNSLPVVDFAAAGALVNTTAMGKKYVVNANLSAPLTVLHLFGSVYETHFAYGQLMSAEIAQLAPQSLEYLFQQVNSSMDLSWLTPAVREAILEWGVDLALDYTWNATMNFTPPHWVDALSGLAAGSGVDLATLRRVAMIAEWTRASCSIVGAWGAATPTGALTQLRALDWDTDGPFQKFPVVAVFHPPAGQGFAFATLGWAGMLGAITGVSSSGLALSEKVWDAYTGSAYGTQDPEPF